MNVEFFTCDVFTDTRFGGNPLAVFPDARALSGEQMQLIAREFNYSETTFVLPSEQGPESSRDPGHTRRMRIFTTTVELPFAGHPNIGTAFVLARQGLLGGAGIPAQIHIEQQAGVVPIAIRAEPGAAIWCELRAPQSLQLGETVHAQRIAEVLSLPADDVVTHTHPPQQASVGLSFVITELRSRDALRRASVNHDALRALAADGVRPALYLYTHDAGDADIAGRMFAPLGGTPEDPATGSANCALAALLSHCHAAASGDFSWRIAQGEDMGRPSVLDARTRKQDGAVSAVWIGGSAVMVSHGHIELD